MADFANHLLFGWYPYLCLTVFLLGSAIRFDREQFSWRSGSSQLLRRKQLLWGSNLFHVGILVIFLGHLRWPADADRRVREPRNSAFRQAIAGDCRSAGWRGLMCLVGMMSASASAAHRSAHQHHVFVQRHLRSCYILLAQLLLGLSTIFVSARHLDGGEMVKFMTWAQGVLTLARRRLAPSSRT